MFALEQLFKRDETVQRYLAAPLARSRLGYLAHRAEQGAKLSTLVGIASIQVKAVRYLALGEGGSVSLAGIEAAAEQWASGDPARRGGNGGKARRNFVAKAAGWLRFAGRLEETAAPPHRHAAQVAEFVDYMRRERGWSEATIRTRSGRANEFLRRFCAGDRTLADVAIADIDRALGRKNARDGRSRSRVTIRHQAHALRAFFRFAEARGWCRPGLAAAIAAPRVYRDAGLPAGPSQEDVRHLLAATEGDRPTDLRARAVLLLLCVYGLRAGAVRGLLLDDIDWEAETLRVRCAKTRRTGPFPLARRVGAAVLRYLRAARPRCAHREIFLTLNAPARPLGVSAISKLVGRLMRRCGIECRRHGAHALRHAFAQRLLDEGFSMHEIGECLGHRSPASTAVYAKVDLAGLRQVADFDLEGLA
jgi:site-specific recombinase XerD